MANDAEGGSGPAPGATRWDRFLYWTGRFHATADFDDIERNYKLVVAERIQAAKDAMHAGEAGWVDTLNHAITAPPNNLTNWRATQPFIAWCRANLEQAALAFRFLWNDDLPVGERFNSFAEVVATSGNKILIAETSFLHMANDPFAFPMYRATPVDRAMDLTGYPLPKETGIRTGDMGGRYEHFLRFLDIMIERARQQGIAFEDRLDAQSAAWIVTQWHPHADWLDGDKAAFRAYQGEAKLRKRSWGEPGSD